MRPGMRFADRYELLNQAGSGGAARVWKARDTTSQRPVAIKVLHRSAERARFQREVRALERLAHPGIVRLLDHGATDDDDLYLVMEWVEGPTVAERLREGPLPVADAVALGVRVATLLGELHRQGLIHRDLKPANLVLADGEPRRAVLIDFGTVLIPDDDTITALQVVLGTPAFMAPEQARSGSQVSIATDIFSLGAVLYTALVGSPPFRGPSIAAVLAKVVLEAPPPLGACRREVPPELSALIHQMLAKHPERRPRDCDAVVEALGRTAERLEDGSRPTTRSSLTVEEQRAVSIVLAVPQPGALDDAPPPPLELANAGAELARLQLRAERLADGSLLVISDSAPTAVERAVAACRGALFLASLWGSDAKVAVATGRAPSRQVADGELIDRAADLLEVTLPAAGEIAGALVDDVTRDLLPVAFELTATPAGAVLVRERPRTSRVGRSVLGRDVPCVGRHKELAMAEAIFDEAVEESVARVLLLTGPPGIGKSCIRRELSRRLRRRRPRPRIWLGIADSTRAGAPLALVADALRRRFALTDVQPPPVLYTRLSRRVTDVVAPSDAERVGEFLGALVGLELPGSIRLLAARDNPQLMHDQLVRAFIDFLSAECARGPVVLFLEDVHWADGPSLKLIDSALSRLADEPLLVVALARPQFVENHPDLWEQRQPQEIRVHELTPKAAQRLVVCALGSEAPAEIVERIAARSAGNAFYIEELVRAEAEGRGDQTPPTLLSTVQARLEALTRLERRLLRAGSVFGEVFWDGAVAALVDLPRSELQPCFEELVRREVIVPRVRARWFGEREYGFRHAVVRDAAYAMLTDDDRRVAHRLAAQWLLQKGEREAVVLAEHFEQSDVPEHSALWWLSAARATREACDLPRAKELALRAVARGARGEQRAEALLIAADAAYSGRGDLDECVRLAREAADAFASGSPSWLRTAAVLAGAYKDRGERESLRRLAAEVYEAWCAEPSDAATHALTLCAIQLRYAGEAERAQSYGGELRRLAREGLRPATRGYLHRYFALEALHAAQFAEMLDQLERSHAAFQQAGDLRNMAWEHVARGFMLIELGALEDATEILHRAISLCERVGARMLRALAQANLGLARAHAGELVEGRALLESAIEMHRGQDNQRLEGAALIYLSRVLLESGEPALARERADRAAAILEHVAPPFFPYALAARARARLARADLPGALADAERAEAIREQLGSLEEGERFLALVHAEVLLAQGDRERARDVALAAVARLEQLAASLPQRHLRQSLLTRNPESRGLIELCHRLCEVVPAAQA